MSKDEDEMRLDSVRFKRKGRFIKASSYGVIVDSLCFKL